MAEMSEIDLDDLERRMSGAIEALTRELGGLRTGRASPALVETLTVDAYGSEMPMNQVGSISVPESRLLTIQVWDPQLVGAVERTIRASDLGLNPQVEGNLVRLPLPDLSEERRQELTKVAGRIAEQGRVAVRNVRRDGMDTLKQMERSGEASEDTHRTQAELIQKLTDNYSKKIDAMLEAKEQEILQV